MGRVERVSLPATGVIPLNQNDKQTPLRWTDGALLQHNKPANPAHSISIHNFKSNRHSQRIHRSV